MDYKTKREILIQYLLMKVEESDWHGVSDAANDIRVMEAGATLSTSSQPSCANCNCELVPYRVG